jgi:hypothetical protein
LAEDISADDGDKKADHRGEREISCKTIACGNAGCSGATVVTNARAYYHYTRGCGCNGHPAFPTPSLGGSMMHNSGAWRGETRNCMFTSLRGAKRRSNPFLLRGYMDCFASLAMTISKRLARWLFENRISKPG